jgi:hypothetical protein
VTFLRASGAVPALPNASQRDELPEAEKKKKKKKKKKEKKRTPAHNRLSFWPTTREPLMAPITNSWWQSHVTDGADWDS